MRSTQEDSWAAQSREQGWKMKLLHLSDLHLASLSQAESLFSRLCTDLHYDLKQASVDAVVISGDISVRAAPEEFAASLWLTEQVIQEFRVPLEALILVPGNHDVDWSVTQAALSPTTRAELTPGTAHIIDQRDSSRVFKLDPVVYAQRFRSFSECFYEKLYARSYPATPADQVEIRSLPEHKTLFLGLNSSWDLNHINSGNPSIEPLAMARAMRGIGELGCDDSWTRIGVWHHPISSSQDDRIRDTGFAEQLAQAGFTLALHGHIHELSTQQLRYEVGEGGRVMHVVAAGTFGADVRELPTATPWEYNFIELEPRHARIVARQRRSENGTWKPYGAWQMGATETASSLSLPLGRAERGRKVMIAERAELLALAEAQGIEQRGARIAVEAHIFDAEGRILLQRRGPKARDEIGRFEGVGGDLRTADDLHEALRSEVKKELGLDVEIRIDELLEVRLVGFVERQDSVERWLIASYLCQLQSGTPRAVNPDLTSELRYFSLSELFVLPQGELSRSTNAAIQTYLNRYGERPYFRN
jgi:ADP-ribose pyrophosphatase YjhB (NUDIX family)